MTSYWIAVAVVLFLVIAYLFYTKNNTGGKGRLPPSPWGLPIVGHLHMLGALPHRSLHQLAKKYGPVFYLRLGLVPTIVVSTPETAELFLKTHDVVFANRPKSQAAMDIFYGQKSLALGEYGPRWRNLRKLCTLELLSSSKIESMKSMRKGHVSKLLKLLMDAAEVGAVVDLSAKVESLIEDITYGMIFGRKYDRFGFKSSVQEIMKLSGAFNLADYLPFVGLLDLQGLGARIKAVSRVVDGYLESIIEEHVEDAKLPKDDDHHRNFVEIMLSLMETNSEFDRAQVKAIMLDMIVGAMDTVTTAIEWVLSELLRNPRVINQVQSELENVVGLDRFVEETDLEKLSYLELAVKESMRLHPVAPLLIPHESMEDITINGYDIPKKTRLIVNTWAIGRDPQVWSNSVDEFLPERFMENNLDFKGHDLRFIPFGSGRRGCPGQQLGLTIVEFVVAQLVHCFSWELPKGMSNDDLDMSENFGITMTRATPLLAIPTTRLLAKKKA